MPVKTFLKPETKKKLQRALKECEHPQVRERILMFFLLNTGNTQTQVAEILGCSVRTVAYWSVQGEPENLESLKDERMKGNHKKATPDYINRLLEIIEK